MTDFGDDVRDPAALAVRLTDYFQAPSGSGAGSARAARIADYASSLSRAVTAAIEEQDYGTLGEAAQGLVALCDGHPRLLAGCHAIVASWIFAYAPEHAESLIARLNDALFNTTLRSSSLSDSRDHAVAMVAEKGEPLRRDRLPDREGTEGLRLPLQVRGQSLGELFVVPDATRAWDPDEEAVLDAVTAQISQALEMARLFQESERRSAQLAAAAEISRAASSLLSLDDLMRTAVDQIRNTFGYDLVRVYLVPEEGKIAELRSASPPLADGADRVVLPLDGPSVVGEAIQRARPVVVARPVPGTGEEDAGQAKLAVPLRIGDRVIGALNVRSHATARFKDDDIAVLQTLADQMAVAIENARAYAIQRQTTEQLRELDQLKSQFLANMSHELRTPLNSIIGFSRVILKGIDGPITEMQEKDLTTIYSSGQLLLQLIDSILDISKLEAGKMELDFTAVEIGQIVDVAMSTATGLVKGRDVRLVRDLPDDLPPIRGDAMRIRQILLNLLSNAAKFTESGEIRVSVRLQGAYLLVRVSDTGLGIPKEKQAKLFDAFYQVDGSATRKVGGTGLGLAISRSFVELHSGQIWVESEGIPGRGTTFLFTLPIESRWEEQGRSLLYSVDAEPAITRLYEMYLTADGHRYHSCNLPSAAPVEAVQLQPDLILFGLSAGKESEELLSLNALKAAPETSAIPVVVCGTLNDPEVARMAMDAGAAHFLEKPVIREDLRQAVRQVLALPDVQPTAGD